MWQWHNNLQCFEIAIPGWQWQQQLWDQCVPTIAGLKAIGGSSTGTSSAIRGNQMGKGSVKPGALT